MDGFAGECGAGGDGLKGFRGWVGDADFGESCGEADAFGEGDDFVDGGLRLRFEHELREQAEGHLFAVHVGVGAVGGGEAVVDGVGGGEAGGFKAEAGEEGVGFDEAFEGGVGGLGLQGNGRGDAVGEEGFVAELGEGEGTLGGGAAAHVFDAAGDADLGFEPGGEGVAHAGDEEAGWALGDDGGVDEDEIGIAAVDAVGFDGAGFVVDDR